MQTAVSAIAHEQDKVIEDFAQFTDWSDKYEYIIDLGKTLAPIDPRYKTDVHLVKGCQSRVWLHAEAKEGRIYLSADSDAVITKGISGCSMDKRLQILKVQIWGLLIRLDSKHTCLLHVRMV